MDLPSTQEPALALSGRTFVARVTFTRLDPTAWVGVREGAVPDDGRQPFGGDLRLAARLDPDSRISSTGKYPCVGSVSASIFDGTCWQRFDLTSVTASIRFASAVQLHGALRWCCTAVRSATGRPCSGATAPDGFTVYSAVQQPADVPAGSPPPLPPPPRASAQPVNVPSAVPEMRRLVYSSTRVASLSDAELVSGLILPAAARNRRDGITGCLYVGRTSFLQAIEGPTSVVRALMKRIAADPRHKNVHVLSDTVASVRLFARWDLKVTREDGTVEALCLEELTRDVAAQDEAAESEARGRGGGKRTRGTVGSEIEATGAIVSISQSRVAQAIIHMLDADAIYS